MSSPYQEQLIDQLPAVVLSRQSLPEDLLGALEEDEELRAWWQRRVDHVRALAGVGSLPAPTDLAGRVVGATQSGHRQDRAVQELVSLERLEAPTALLDAVVRETMRPFADSDGDPFGAPAVLDQMVEQQFQDGDLEDRWSTEGWGHETSRKLRRPAGMMAAAFLTVCAVTVGAWLRMGTVQADGGEQVAEATGTEHPVGIQIEIEHLTVDEAVARGDSVAAILSPLVGGIIEGSQR